MRLIFFSIKSLFQSQIQQKVLNLTESQVCVLECHEPQMIFCQLKILFTICSISSGKQKTNQNTRVFTAHCINLHSQAKLNVVPGS